MSGGYGYCMGPAIAGNYVWPGRWSGGKRGVLNIYALRRERSCCGSFFSVFWRLENLQVPRPSV